MAKDKILFIDDDQSVHSLMKCLFEETNYQLIPAYNGKEGLAILAKEKPDLLLLDVMMPGLDGYEVCNQIRKQGRHIPIIMLTAKGDIIDKRMGYRFGADDYVVKPFNSEELLLRVEALIRRHKSDVSAIKTERSDDYLKVGDLEIYFNNYEVFLRGERVNFTAREFEVLAFLAANQGQVFTREQISAQLWNEEESDENSITVFVHKIRSKIEDDPSDPKYLLTVWRVGYKFGDAPR